MMFTGSNKDYRVDRHYQAQRRREADEWRRAQEGQENDEPVVHGRRWLLRTVVIALVLLSILIGAREAFAQGPEPRRLDAGGPPEPFAEAMVAYREGLYELKHGDYEQAVERLSAAVEGIPVDVIAAVPVYQDMYWVLGEAQEAAGMAEDAVASYQYWLSLVGDDAAPWTRAKVRQMEVELEIVRLITGRSQGLTTRGTRDELLGVSTMRPDLK